MRWARQQAAVEQVQAHQPKPSRGSHCRHRPGEPLSRGLHSPPNRATVARVFDQDGSNLPQVQRGMKASKKGTITLANYQEVRIRHFHQTLDKYLSA